MAIEFRCDYCGAALSLADSLAGQQTSCPSCGVTVVVPGMDLGGAATVKQQPLQARKDTKPCQYCGEQVNAQAWKCPHCGEQLRGDTNRFQSKDPAIESAATLALIFGLLGFLFCQLFSFVALWQGYESKNRAAANGIDTPGTAMAGIILGWIGVGLLVLSLGLVCLIFGVGFAGAAAQGGG